MLRKWGSNNYKDYYMNLQGGNFYYEDKFTLSFWAKKNSGNGNIRCYFHGSQNYVQDRVIAHNGTYGNTQFADGQVRFTLTDEWERYYVTWELDNETD